MATPALSETELNQALVSLAGWELDNDMITKTYQLPSYMAGLAFASAVGTLCEARDHHPDLFIGWKKVKVSFTTHDAGSKVTQKDIDAAKAIEAIGYPKS
ncbi:MAG: 4a-hydroxytetrahydrobiopterin dehydratase [Aggregatilineales bacterium]